MSWVTNSTAVCASSRRALISPLTTLCCARSSDSRGSSQSSNCGSVTSACATRRRCCSPPDNVPIGASAYALGADGFDRVVDAGSRAAAGQRKAAPVPVDPELHEVTAADRQIAVERVLLGDVPDLAVAPAGRLADRPPRCPPTAGSGRAALQQRRLSRAVRAEYRKELAGRARRDRGPGRPSARRIGRWRCGAGRPASLSLPRRRGAPAAGAAASSE